MALRLDKARTRGQPLARGDGILASLTDSFATPLWLADCSFGGCLPGLLLSGLILWKSLPLLVLLGRTLRPIGRVGFVPKPKVKTGSESSCPSHVNCSAVKSLHVHFPLFSPFFGRCSLTTRFPPWKWERGLVLVLGHRTHTCLCIGRL